MSSLFDSEHKKETCKILCIGITSVTLLGLALILTVSIINRTSESSYSQDQEAVTSDDEGQAIYPADEENGLPYIPQPLSQNLYYVHLIPHSHQDACWLDNVDGYYTKSITKIFDGVTSSLEENTERKFSVADMMFFKRWYMDQNQHVRDKWKHFVKNEQVEFINGGWVSTDEATPTYDQLIENMHMGHQFLWDEFKYVPQFAWEVDTFGHSAMNAQIFAQMGFKAMFYQRQDYRDKDWRRNNGELEYIWQPSFEQLDPSSPQAHNESLFIHVFHGGYMPPDIIRMQNPFNRIHYTEKDIPQLSTKLAKHLEERKLGYKTHHLLIPMGDDFSYNDAPKQFSFIDMLIKEFDKRLQTSSSSHRYKIFYSNIHNYYKSVMQEAENKDIQFSVEQGDFEPYINDRGQVWSGYYTSRPGFKTLIKSFANIAQSSSTLYSYAMMAMMQDHQILDTEWQKELQDLSQSLLETQSLMMHHDTITGTSQVRVIKWDQDYLWDKLNENEEMLEELLIDMVNVKNDKGSEKLVLKDLNACYLDLKNEENYTQKCSFMDLKKSTILVVYNPSLEQVRVPALELETEFVDVSEWNWKKHRWDQLKAEGIEFERGLEDKKFEVFLDSVIEGETLAMYLLERCDEKHSVAIVPEVSRDIGQISNDQVHLSLNAINGNNGKGSATFTYYDLVTSLQEDFIFDLRTYKSASSGTYTWKSSDKDSAPHAHSIKEIRIFHGALVKQMQLLYNPEEDSTPSLVKINLYTSGPLTSQIEFDVFLGKMENVGSGKELTVNWKLPNFDQKGVFYTDANELEILKRTVNFKESVPFHFFPVDSFIMVEDQGVQMTVVNSLSEAGSAWQKGRIELIMNRRIMRDDNLGMAEPLKELLNFQTKYYLQFSQDRSQGFAAVRKRQHMVDHHPFTYFTQNFRNRALSGEKEVSLNQYMGIKEIENIFVYPKPSLDSFVVRVTLSMEGVHLLADDLANRMLTDAFEKQSVQHGEMPFDFSGKVKVKQLGMDEVREMKERTDDNYLLRKDCIIQVFEVEMIPSTAHHEKFLPLEQQ